MKNILILFFLLITNILFGQYQYQLNINPDQKKTERHIAMSFTGKDFYGNNVKANSFQKKGAFTSYKWSEVLESILTQVRGEITDSLSTTVTIEEVRTEISDSLATISGGGFFTASTATEPTILQDAANSSFTAYDFSSLVIAGNGSAPYLLIDGANTSASINSDGSGTAQISVGNAFGVAMTSSDSLYQISTMPKVDVGAGTHYLMYGNDTQIYAKPIGQPDLGYDVYVARLDFNGAADPDVFVMQCTFDTTLNPITIERTIGGGEYNIQYLAGFGADERKIYLNYEIYSTAELVYGKEFFISMPSLIRIAALDNSVNPFDLSASASAIIELRLYP